MRTGVIVGLTLLGVGCGAELTVEPGTVDWGTVDFNQPVPDAGHDAREITLTNSGSGSLEVVVLDLEDDRLTLAGQFTTTDPPRLELGKGDVAVLTLGVSGYEPGETGQQITGEVTFAAGRLRDDVILPWSYIPERDAPDP